MEEEFDFDTWFDLYVDKCRQLGWKGAIDRGSAQMDYELCKTPEEAAEYFVRGINE